jgi:outer membrane protein OmpA-like peptidoglycan-associated protein
MKMTKIQIGILLAAMLLLPETISAQEQQDGSVENEQTLPLWNIKTNLLYDATATVNLGLEFRLGERFSFDLPFNYNAWTFSENRKWKHILVQPELRWWTRETFRGHFFGLHGHYAFYNVGHLPHGPFSQHMNTHRYEGWLAGAGLSYGYRWNFNHRWALEATVGAGYAYMSHDKFECGRCGERLGSANRHYFGPTRAGITLIFGIGGKQASKSKPAPVYVPAPVVVIPEPAVPYEPSLHASFVAPEAEAVKARSLSGKAYLDFAVGRSEIVPGFRNNASELQKIHTLMESVKSDPDAILTHITITGYASPEGTSPDNQVLSERRAQALKGHIASIHGLREDMFRVWGAGEDWATLDTLVAASGLSEKYRVLEIIRTTDSFDGRDGKLMALAGGNTYRQMKETMFPQLRRSDYSIGYTVLPFTAERGKEVFRSRPDNLSLNEMFLIANTYEPGSGAFNEVFETAARLYPSDNVACINAAASALERKDTVSAARYLDRVKEHTPDYWNNMGLLAWLQGDKTKAAEYFAKGGIQGNGNAVELQKHIESTKEKVNDIIVE